MAEQYQVGYVWKPNGLSVLVGYQPRDVASGAQEQVCVVVGVGPMAKGPIGTPRELLSFRNIHALWKEEGDSMRFDGLGEEPNWFQNRCNEAGCGWFVPMVERMVAGDEVPIEEIQAAYLAHNGKPMPCGEWRHMFS